MKKINLLFVIVAVALLSCRAGGVAVKPTAHDWLLRGVELEQSNVHEEAIKMYTEAISLDGYYGEAYFRRAKAHMAANKTSVMEAMQDFNMAIDLDPKNAEAYYERGLLNAFSINNENARTDMLTAAGLGHKGAQQWLTKNRLVKKEKEAEEGAERGPTTTAASPLDSGQPAAAGTEQQASPEKGEAFLAPDKLSPSGSAWVVRFDYDKADIKEQYYPLLDEAARFLIEKEPEVIVILAGHTDNTGTEKYNAGLSMRRAKAVEAYLTDEQGVPDNRFSLKSYGESTPIATNDTEEGRAQNRRVEILPGAGKSGEPPSAEQR